ncbi:hypothetical protein [Hydrogenimonas sp.]
MKFIVIENDYLLKSELTSRIALLIFFGWCVSINLTPETDSLDELYRRLALGTAVIGILWALLSNMKMLIGLIKNRLYIKIYDDSIVYEYINIGGEKKSLIVHVDDYKNISWSILPIFGEVNKVVDENRTINEKLEYIVSFIPRVIINLFFGSIFYVISFFKLNISLFAPINILYLCLRNKILENHY